MVNGNDLVEFEEENFENLLEDYLDNRGNKRILDEWLEDEGYELFLKKSPNWNSFVNQEFSEWCNE
jgi:hypothetical protein